MNTTTAELAAIIRRRALDAAVRSMRITATERLVAGDTDGASQLVDEINRTIGAAR